MRIPWKERIVYTLVGLVLIGLVVAYVPEFYYFKRTFEIKTMALVAAGVGVVAGGILGVSLGRKAADTVERIQIFLLCVVLVALFSPLLASLSNRLISPQPVKMESVAFFEQKAYVSERFGFLLGEKVRTSGYYLFFIRNGKMYRMDNRRPVPGAPQRGDTMEIPVRKGLWGVEWVERWP